MTPAVLITGAAGYVGQRLAERLLAEHAGLRVVLFVHRPAASTVAVEADVPAAATAAPALPARLAGFADRVTLVTGELGDAVPFAGVDAAAITHIVHAAAVTRFNVDAATADRVNVDGTAKLLAFAERCPNLVHLTLVSTLYASGLAVGRIAEAPLEGAAGFANHYERSKWQSERLLLERHARLPATIARVATIIADDESGAVTQKNAVHNTLRLLFHGLLSLVPGHAATPLYFVTGDLVVSALAALTLAPPRSSSAPGRPTSSLAAPARPARPARPAGLSAPAPGPAPRIVHVCHPRAAAGTLGELIDCAYQVFEADPAYQRRRLLRPLFADAESFDLLASGIDGFGGEPLRQALGSVAPFARQLFVDKDCENRELIAATGLGANAPDARALVRATAAWLVRTRWGREPGAPGIVPSPAPAASTALPVAAPAVPATSAEAA